MARAKWKVRFCRLVAFGRGAEANGPRSLSLQSRSWLYDPSWRRRVDVIVAVEASKIRRGVAQLVEFELWGFSVAGSSPATPTISVRHVSDQSQDRLRAMYSDVVRARMEDGRRQHDPSQSLGLARGVEQDRTIEFSAQPI